jgi:hypothetical protein
MPKKDDTLEFKMIKAKETRHTIAYDSANGDPVRTVYVTKGAFTPMPDALRLTLEAVRPRDEAG